MDRLPSAGRGQPIEETFLAAWKLPLIVAAIAVVIVGGMGSLAGSALGALVVGLFTEFGLGYFPQYAESLTFAAIAAVLILRPAGLVGRLR